MANRQYFLAVVPFVSVKEKPMKAYQYFALQIISGLFVLIFSGTSAMAVKIGMRNEGNAQIIGSVISAPCSIVMENRYQAVDFSSLTFDMLATQTAREQQAKPFEIELRDCGNIFNSIDSKTWTIRFDGQNAENIDAFILQGPSRGLGVSIFDNEKNKIIPSVNYPLFNNVLKQDKSGRTLFLRYFLQLELTGEPIQAGSYQGLIRFFIDYQ